jgi:hypothetical protein
MLQTGGNRLVTKSLLEISRDVLILLGQIIIVTYSNRLVM